MHSMIFRGILVFPNFARLKIKNEMCTVAQSKERCLGAMQNEDQAPCPRAFLETEPALLHHTSPQSSSPMYWEQEKRMIRWVISALMGVQSFLQKACSLRKLWGNP